MAYQKSKLCKPTTQLFNRQAKWMLPAAVMLLLTVTFTTANVRAQGVIKSCSTSQFFVASDSGRLHFAFATSDCSDSVAEYCNNRALDVKRDCEYRNEDGGTEYSSCRCQSIRYGSDCYRNSGCQGVSDMVMEMSPECFGDIIPG